MRIVADQTVTGANRSVNVLSVKSLLLVAPITEFVILAFQIEIKLRPMRVMTTSAFTVSNRRV
jgi:hypothetical protein